ncbi:hypothetical protein [Paraclostridium sp. AKS81]|uniref:hypothetical protein n=1 Tax=Paraclostridium sp. AKS81 TaxID=2876117 RepID=UPI0021E09094|nr:hypothetical protein [Paraclostridium sp. AKS81]MCU9813237.1 hypothetical protein [Paraclostridium sp. AKS81]
MKKYDEFELDLKNEEVENNQPMARSVFSVKCIYDLTKWSVKNGCGKDTTKYNSRTLNACRTA